MRSKLVIPLHYKLFFELLLERSLGRLRLKLRAIYCAAARYLPPLGSRRIYPSYRGEFFNGKSMRKYLVNVPKNTRMVVDLSPGGAAYSSIRIKTPTFEDVGQLLPDWALASF